LKMLFYPFYFGRNIKMKKERPDESSFFTLTNKKIGQHFRVCPMKIGMINKNIDRVSYEKI